MLHKTRLLKTASGSTFLFFSLYWFHRSFREREGRVCWSIVNQSQYNKNKRDNQEYNPLQEITSSLKTWLSMSYIRWKKMKYVKEEKNDRKISVAVLSGDNTQCYNEINHLNFLFNILKIYNFCLVFSCRDRCNKGNI